MACSFNLRGYRVSVTFRPRGGGVSVTSGRWLALSISEVTGFPSRSGRGGCEGLLPPVGGLFFHPGGPHVQPEGGGRV